MFKFVAWNICLCGQPVLGERGSGAFHRRSPKGGTEYGIPAKSHKPSEQIKHCVSTFAIADSYYCRKNETANKLCICKIKNNTEPNRNKQPYWSYHALLLLLEWVRIAYSRCLRFNNN
jgi:hypothetical protein